MLIKQVWKCAWRQVYPEQVTELSSPVPAGRSVTVPVAPTPAPVWDS